MDECLSAVLRVSTFLRREGPTEPGQFQGPLKATKLLLSEFISILEGWNVSYPLLPPNPVDLEHPVVYPASLQDGRFYLRGNCYTTQISPSFPWRAGDDGETEALSTSRSLSQVKQNTTKDIHVCM